MAISPSKRGLGPRRHRLAIGGILLALVLIGLGGYWFLSNPDTLHLTVVNSDESLTVLDTTTHDGASAQRLYAHILALPGAPAGTYSCPFGAQDIYHLTFSHWGITTLDTEVNAGSCRFLRVYFTLKSDDGTFWQLLSQAVGQSLPLPPNMAT